MPRAIAGNPTTHTTAQQLGSIIKTARDIMRKDKGLNGDLDRLPMLTWVLFLKFLDDHERQREVEATLDGTLFFPAIAAPYRWRDWAANEDGITGDELLHFINDEQVAFPDDTRGKGLFAYLRGLSGGTAGDRRDVIATVFQGITNRMINGWLLRDVINKVNGIHFTSSDEIHTLGHLYETLLREMRDAAGDAGEFYTPRALVKFIVQVTDPRLGETVLDPACGTGGFLVEAFAHLAAQCKTVQESQTLQTASVFGIEPKPLPYLLAQMNLLLHGLEAPRIDPGNALRFRLGEIGDGERVDIILTNPPFGGEEERGIADNFPPDKRTSETALLFLQLIMRRLRRGPVSAINGRRADDDRKRSAAFTPEPYAGPSGPRGLYAGPSGSSPYAGPSGPRASGPRPGRAGMVVPNGTLFGDGVAARIKEELLKEFNLHTIVRLPNGVFAPYTSIPTNLLFFDRSGPTREVWYYEQPMPDGRKNYTKTNPMRYEDFADCLAWWDHREENERAWRVPAATLLENGCNLDQKNPRAKQDIEHLPPGVLAASILEKERRIAAIVADIQRVLAEGAR